jgi:hypothetical protein
MLYVDSCVSWLYSIQIQVIPSSVQDAVQVGSRAIESAAAASAPPPGAAQQAANEETARQPDAEPRAA